MFCEYGLQRHLATEAQVAIKDERVHVKGEGKTEDQGQEREQGYGQGCHRTRRNS